MTKQGAIAIMTALVVAVLLPVHPKFRGKNGDEFPFSWYPMFSRPRPKLEPVHYMLGLGAQGQRYIIPSRYYVPGGMNQARRQLDRLARHKHTARATCEKTAANIAGRKAFQDVVELRLVRGYFDTEKYFSKGQKLPEKEQVRARCRAHAQRDEGGA